MSEMIKRVGGAILLAQQQWNPKTAKEPLEVVVGRAAIEAMREPTDGMKACNEDVHWGYSCGECGGLQEGWYAMIDAALGDKGEAL